MKKLKLKFGLKKKQILKQLKCKMFQLLVKREFHSAVPQLAKRKTYAGFNKKAAQKAEKKLRSRLIRQRNAPPTTLTAEIRPPVPPTVENITVSDDHPLWQFFHDKKFMREFTELDQSGRPWSIPELRKKSFDDLHSLWYTCLKERNILTREHHVLRLDTKNDGESRFLEQAEKIRQTMWRIRFVLGERNALAQNAKDTLPEFKAEFLPQFREYYVNAPEEKEAEIQKALKRLHLSVFGIYETISKNNRVDRYFLEGLRYVANLKLDRYAKDHHFYDMLTPIEDVSEAFILFHADANKASVNEAIDAIGDLRKKGIKVERFEEVATIKRFIKDLTRE